MKRSRSAVVLLVLAAGVFFTAGTAAASVRNGLSIGIGLGGVFADEEDAYLGTERELYPEVQVAYDVGPLRLGVHAGYLWSKNDVVYNDPKLGPRFREEEVAFFPLEADICILPLRAIGHGRLAFQPYIGAGVGTMLASGDNTEDLSIAPVVRAGIEFYAGDFTVIGIDVAHHEVEKAGNGADYSYTTAMLELRFRIPFVREHQHGASGQEIYRERTPAVREERKEREKREERKRRPVRHPGTHEDPGAAKPAE